MQHAFKIVLLGLSSISLAACSANAEMQESPEPEHQTMMVEATVRAGVRFHLSPSLPAVVKTMTLA
ncbi:hypothetical protein [Vibrio sp.]|uniref:hypothetical protein n=1 Tax=Vibrio sp. TaxID=678 RepID=UPI003AA9CC7B